MLKLQTFLLLLFYFFSSSQDVSLLRLEMLTPLTRIEQLSSYRVMDQLSTFVQKHSSYFIESIA